MNTAQGNYRILIVDKSGRGAFFLSSLLSSKGYKVFTVNSFLKAIDYGHHAHFPHLIIVDQQEPCTIFFEFPRKFHERTGIKIPIIAHSISVDKETIARAVRSGYNDYLVRPIDPDLLLDKVANLVNPDINLNQKTFRFNLTEEATMNFPFMIDSINEFGILAQTLFEVPAGTVFDLESPTLIKNGLKKIKVAVVECKSSGQSIYPFTVKLSFVGLKSSELTLLRKMAMFKGESLSA